jgi:hypothetical protein
MLSVRYSVSLVFTFQRRRREFSHAKLRMFLAEPCAEENETTVLRRRDEPEFVKETGKPKEVDRCRVR